ncbi:MAG TPA: hypothetical protein VIO38_12155 [Rariglobus sp.]
MVTPPPPRRQDGFALLITITLLAFLVLLLVSLATLTRVETTVAQNNQIGALARQNALLGLNIALGQLQKHAGPDQRVTARADIGGTQVQPHLTGVWNSTSGSTLSPSTPATWLISGNEGTDPLAVTPASFDPATAAAASEVLLVDTGTVSTPAMRIKAPVQSIRSDQVPGLSGSTPIGGYAWWIGDEGVKARIALDDPHATAPTADERLYSFVSTQRPDIAQVVSPYPSDSTLFPNVLSLKQLPLAASNASDQTALSTAVNARFHDLTPCSASVLADVAAGGLKKDLTAWLSNTGTLPSGAPADTDPIIPAASGGNDFMMPQWGIVRSWNTLRASGSTPIPPQQQTQSRQGLYPVITYFNLGLAISQGEPSAPARPFRVHLYPTVVLWNPFNVAIESPYELCFLIRREGIPGRYITFSFTATGTTRTLDYRLWRLLDGPARTAPYLRFSVESTRLGPGESRIFTLRDADDGHEYDPATPGNQTLANALNVANSVTLSSSAALATAERDSPVSWSTAEGTEMDIVLRQAGLAEPTPVGTNWNNLLPGAYHTVQRAGFGNISPMPSAAVNPSAFAAQIYWYTSLRLSGSSNTARWIAQLNSRAPLNTRTGAENTQGSYIAGGARGSGNLSYPDAPLASIGNKVNDSARNLVLAEFLPSGVPLFSLAQLQHATLSLLGNQPTYAAGNSLADFHIPLDKTSFSADAASVSTTALSNSISTAYDVSYLLNQALWDRYFFSTTPDSFTTANRDDPAYRLPNALIRQHDVSASTPLAELRGRDAFHTAATHLLLQGGFNINSTSELAWRALLAGRNGLLYDPVNAATSTTPLAYPYSRFSRPAAGVNGDWAGYRQLTSDQINRLARNIVTEVKARGPFRSLADFINRRPQAIDNTAGREGGAAFKGALQAAIDRTDFETTAPAAGEPALAPINTHATFTTNYVDRANVRPSAVTGITGNYGDLISGGTGSNRAYSARSAFAPGYLTQADLLTAIGPSLVARSDTFRIRAYGETKNPVTGGISGRVWCEALVQRVPDLADNASAPIADIITPSAATHPFGRRFKIVSFRWLSAADL